MSVALMLGIACLGMLVMVATIGIGAVLLIRLRVITPYAAGEEPPDWSGYGLDQGRGSGE
jgi:hypothetical protein